MRERESDCWGVCYAVAAALTPMIAAMSLGFTSPAIGTMSGADSKDVVPPHLFVFTDSDDASWFASLINVGALVGSLFGAFFCTALGLRGTIQISAALFCITWAVVFHESATFTLLCMRTIMGIGVGLQSVVTPMFIAEVSPLHLRGTLGTLNAAAILFGVVIVDIVGGSIFRTGKFCNWRSLSLFICIWSAVLFLVSLFLPEPRRPKLCRQCCPRKSSGDASGLEALDVEEPDTPTTPTAPITPTAQGDSNRRNSRRVSLASVEEPSELGNCDMMKLAIAGFVPLVWQQLSGINLVIAFGQQILAKAGLHNFNILGSSVIGVQLFGIAIAASVIEKVGRRPLLLVSSGGMAVSAAVFGFLLGSATPSSVAIMASLYAYVLSFAVGLGPIPWLLLPEIGLPRRIRGYLASIATAANWGCSFAVMGPPVQALEQRFGVSGQFLFFAAMCLVGFIIMLFILPETRRRRRFGLERQLFSRASWSRTFSRTFSGSRSRFSITQPTSAATDDQ